MELIDITGTANPSNVPETNLNSITNDSIQESSNTPEHDYIDIAVPNNAELSIDPKHEPEPLRAPIPKAVQFPVEALGEVLGAAAAALHETIKAPVTLCCQSVLASASLAAQAHFDVGLPWGGKKPLSLNMLTVAESGERKTGVDDVVLSIAKSQERQDMGEYIQALKLYGAELAQWKVVDASNKAAAKAPKNQVESNIEAIIYTCPVKPEPPIMPIRLVTDPTVEGLYKLFEISQPSIGLFSDEAGLLIGGHTLNSDNALKTLARLSKLWEGAPYDRVRGGDGCGILYGRRLTLHLMAQPVVMESFLGSSMANGQGFLSRCLVAWPESTIGTRQIKAFESPKDREEVKHLFVKLKLLYESPARTEKNVQELDPIELTLNMGAKQVIMDAMNEFETLMQAGNDLSEMHDRASKAAENACRIAGVMTAIEDGMDSRIIDAERLGRALIIVRWYLNEALRIKKIAVVPQSVTDAESLSKWLDDRSLLAFRSATVLTRGPSHLRNKQRLDAAINELVINGYFAENEPGIVIDGAKTKKSWSVLYSV